MPKTLDFPRFFLKQAMKFMNFMPVFVARIKIFKLLHYIYNIKVENRFTPKLLPFPTITVIKSAYALSPKKAKSKHKMPALFHITLPMP